MRRLGWSLPGVALVLGACNGLTGVADLGICDSCAEGGVETTARPDADVAELDGSARDGATDAPRTDDAPLPDAATESGIDAAADAGGCNGAADCVRLVFVTSADYTGALGGVGGADAKCQAAASASKVPQIASRTFLAWISTSTTSPSLRFTHGTQPYVGLDGKVIASDWADLTDGTLQNGISIDETGASRSGSGAWTGTSSVNASYSAPDCALWASVLGGQGNQGGTRGNVGGAGGGWSSSAADGCAIPHALYCFEK